MSCRSQQHEVQLIMMRLISVFMSRTKAGTKPSGEVSRSIFSVYQMERRVQSGSAETECLWLNRVSFFYFQSSSFISSSTANAMLQAGGLDFCLIILQNLLDHWKKVLPEEVSSSCILNLNFE